MLTFSNKYQVIERVENFGGYLLLRQLQPDDNLGKYSDDKIIAVIIASKFHQWQGEQKAEGNTVQMSASDIIMNSKKWTLSNHMFYGFFDNNKIKPDHYKLISYETFSDILFQAISQHAEYDRLFVVKSKELIHGAFNSNSVFYFLDLDKDKNIDMVSEWHVYGFFYTFISLDRQHNLVTLIEFGQD